MHPDAFIGILILLRFFRAAAEWETLVSDFEWMQKVWKGGERFGAASTILNAFPSLLYRLSELSVRFFSLYLQCTYKLVWRIIIYQPALIDASALKMSFSESRFSLILFQLLCSLETFSCLILLIYKLTVLTKWRTNCELFKMKLIELIKN